MGDAWAYVTRTIGNLDPMVWCDGGLLCRHTNKRSLELFLSGEPDHALPADSRLVAMAPGAARGAALHQRCVGGRGAGARRRRHGRALRGALCSARRRAFGNAPQGERRAGFGLTCEAHCARAPCAAGKPAMRGGGLSLLWNVVPFRQRFARWLHRRREIVRRECSVMACWPCRRWDACTGSLS
jgi:hypothetical protein